MARAVVYNTQNVSVGEFQATIPRGWSLLGTPRTSGGASVSVSLPEEVATQAWMQLGSYVLVEHASLPPWVGFLDVPWQAIPPIKVTMYDAQYYLAQRTPDKADRLKGDIPSVIRQALEMINPQGETFFRVGSAFNLPAIIVNHFFEMKPMWEQINDFCIRNGVEAILRPALENKQLILYLDLGVELGREMDAWLFDGQNGNMRVIAAELDGPIWNRAIGIGSDNTVNTRNLAGPYADELSESLYRVRSRVEQFRDVTDVSLLAENAQKFLAYHKTPYLKLTMEIQERAFRHLRLGNTLLAQASRLILPGGVRGWMGRVRIVAMDYDETKNVVTIQAEAYL